MLPESGARGVAPTSPYAILHLPLHSSTAFAAGSSSEEGYKNLGIEFGHRTGRNYTQKQFKNKWDSTKVLYQAWVYYTTKATGLGWDPVKKTFTADEARWAKLIKTNKLIAGFRKGPLENLELMDVMYDDAHVDGTSMVMPGVAKEVPADFVDLLDDDVGSVPTPPSMNRKWGY